MSGRHAIKDPVGVFLAGVYIAGSAILMTVLGTFVSETVLGPQSATSREPVPVSAPDTPAPDL